MARFRKKLTSIAIGVLGQSNEHGAVPTSERAAYPQAFASLQNPHGCQVPIGPSVSIQGGWWPYVYDALRDYGYETKIVNGAIGSASMINHFAGVMSFRDGFLTQGFQRRGALVPMDRGHAGTRIAPTNGTSGPVWVLKAGARRQAAMGSGMTPIFSNGSTTVFDYLLTTSETTKTGGARFTATFSGTTMTVTSVAQGTISVNDYVYGFGAGFNLLSGAPKISSLGTGSGGTGTYNLDVSQPTLGATIVTTGPNFAFTSIGAEVIDGDYTWECESGDALTNYGGKYNTVFTETQMGKGFDPFGILQRLHEEMQVVDAERKIIYIQNAQSDTSASATTYSSALQSVANFFLNRGYEVMIGLSCYQSTSNLVSAYDTLQTGRASALTALKAGPFGSKVYDGANLYASMGTTGVMAAGGAFMQADNTHLNGAGCVGPDVGGISCAGKYVTDAFKAVLPDRRPLTF